ncbi:MAG: beta-glucoside-specific PTS transporter subunit IIABC [Lachnospiraceae bacterium]|nr:beta-glucoside-specific PTS transporter subunit IIABC [Lachnospiraceae bacterium]
MALDYVETSKRIIEAVGGASNIASATNCMTRLRLVLNDQNKANDDAVSQIKGVKSVIKQGGQYQIVIGNEVSNLFKEFTKHGNWTKNSNGAKADEGTPVQRFFGFISGCMTPMLPAMLGCGMLKVILTLLTTFAHMDTASSTYILLFSFADCFFMFLPIFMGSTIAKKVGGSPVLFMSVGAALCYPELIGLMSGSMELGTFLGMPCTYLFGIPVICATYTSSVLPMLLMAPVMKWAEDFADRVSPNVVKSFLKPLLFLIICIPCSLYVLGPIGNVAGNLMSGIFMKMYHTVPWLTVGILAAIMPFVVMTGMHYALIPLAVNNMATLGYDVVVGVTMFCSNIAQGGASFGVALKSKNTETRSEGIACGVSATVAGVTEPAMFGINLRYGKPMIAAIISAGIAGLFCGLTAVRGYTMTGSISAFAVISFIGGEEPLHGLIFGIIGAVISLVLAAVLSFILYKDPEKMSVESDNSSETVTNNGTAAEEMMTVIKAPISGKVISLEDVPDETFAGKVLGEGFAIEPSEGKVYAPFDGICESVFDTLHALSLKSDTGVELLIHVGLETVRLEGKPFTAKVEAGQRIHKGQILLEFDIKMIREMGCNTITPIIVANQDELPGMKIEDDAIIIGG